MNTSRIDVATAFRSVATREAGAEARLLVLSALNQWSSVVLDFSGVHPTPSFADEFVGRLAEELGAAAFRQRIRVMGADRTEQLLLQQVVSHRLKRLRRQHEDCRPATH